MSSAWQICADKTEPASGWFKNSTQKTDAKRKSEGSAGKLCRAPFAVAARRRHAGGLSVHVEPMGDVAEPGRGGERFRVALAAAAHQSHPVPDQAAIPFIAGG